MAADIVDDPTDPAKANSVEVLVVVETSAPEKFFGGPLGGGGFERVTLGGPAGGGGLVIPGGPGGGGGLTTIPGGPEGGGGLTPNGPIPETG